MILDMIHFMILLVQIKLIIIIVSYIELYLHKLGDKLGRAMLKK